MSIQLVAAISSPANASAGSNATTVSVAKERCERLAQNTAAFDPAYFAEHGHGATNPLAKLGAGDSMLHFDILSEDDSKDVFQALLKEVQWSRMFHKGGPVPRLVAIQGEISDNNYEPIYRHPLDHHIEVLSFSPTIDRLRHSVQARLGLCANHALIQLYRTQEDYISEHADKTLDIKIGTAICNLSFGATRVLTLRTKSKVGRLTQVLRMHGSYGCMGHMDIRVVRIYGSHGCTGRMDIRVARMHGSYGCTCSRSLRQIVVT